MTLQDIQPWQTLIGSAVALIAISVTYYNTSRTLAKTEKLEAFRRSQKQSALRAVLPLAMSEVCQYAEEACHKLLPLLGYCENSLLVHDGFTAPEFPALPPDVIKSLSEFIEYADELDLQLLRALVRKMQILKARLSSFCAKMADRAEVTSESWLVQLMLDCAVLYAHAAAAFEFARGEVTSLRASIHWENVRSTLQNMGLWEDEVPAVYRLLEQRQQSDAPVK